MCQLPIPVERPLIGGSGSGSGGGSGGGSSDSGSGNNNINNDNNSNNNSSSMNSSSDGSNPLIQVDEIRKPMMLKDYHNLRVNGVISFAVSKILNDSNSFAKRSTDEIITEYKSMLGQVRPVVHDSTNRDRDRDRDSANRDRDREGGREGSRWQLKKGLHRVAVLNDESQGALVSEIVIH